jgi:lipoprotein-releasing system permease protein
MFRPLALYIGLRYTRAKRRNHFISFISLISILGIALGVTALITVLSVMNGFEKELRERMLGMSPHIMVFPEKDVTNQWQPLSEEIRKHPQVTGVAPYIQGQAMVSFDKNMKGVFLQGIVPSIEPQVSKVPEKLKVGHLEDLKSNEFKVIIGHELARSLRVSTGDQITIVVPQASVTPVGVMPRMKRMTIAGIFEMGIHEFDSNFVLMHIDDAAKLLRVEEGFVHGLNIKLDDMFAATKVKKEFVNTLPAGFYLQDWTHRHANFFKAVKMEKRVMFIILTLIIAVAAFNIISTLVMLVTDKQADIAILRTLGATPLTIMTIFVVQGVIIGLFGTLLGVIGGVSLALNVETLVPAIENFFNMKFLSADVYYISDIPSDLRLADVYWITINAFLISLLATLYPAYRASRTQPAEALRYE